MEKTLTQRLNEVTVEAAEILLEQMKKVLEEPDLFVGTVQIADAISKLHVSAEPMDLTADVMKMVFGKTLPAPGDHPDDYDEKKNSGLIEE